MDYSISLVHCLIIFQSSHVLPVSSSQGPSRSSFLLQVLLCHPTRSNFFLFYVPIIHYLHECFTNWNVHESAGVETDSCIFMSAQVLFMLWPKGSHFLSNKDLYAFLCGYICIISPDRIITSKMRTELF